MNEFKDDIIEISTNGVFCLSPELIVATFFFSYFISVFILGLLRFILYHFGLLIFFCIVFLAFVTSYVSFFFSHCELKESEVQARFRILTPRLHPT